MEGRENGRKRKNERMIEIDRERQNEKGGRE